MTVRELIGLLLEQDLELPVVISVQNGDWSEDEPVTQTILVLGASPPTTAVERQRRLRLEAG